MLILTRTQRVHLNESKRALRVCLKAAIESLGKIEPGAIVAITNKDAPLNTPRWYASRVAKDMIERDSISDDNDEYRLNNAGFKMYVHMGKDGRLKAYIHGDQRWSHPMTYRFLTAMFKFYDLLPDDRDPIDLP